MGVRRSLGRLALLASVAVVCSARGQDRRDASKVGSGRAYFLNEGAMTFRFRSDLMDVLGFRFVPQGQLASDEQDQVVVLDLDLTAAPQTELSSDGTARLGGGPLATCGAFLLDRPGERVVIGNLTLCSDPEGALTLRSRLGDESETIVPFELGDRWMEFDARRGQLVLQAELLLGAEWAGRLEIPETAGVFVGSVTLEALTDRRAHPGTDSSDGACDWLATAGIDTVVAATNGPDVLVADLQSVFRYTPVGDYHAFAVGTTACNIGNMRADWVAATNQHPVIIQNLYRLREDRFEQIGMSWVKHGFYAISESFCETCNDPTNGSSLGVGCSDPYSANLNGIQTNMSPRSTVNANTGYFPYPWNGPPASSTIERRLQVLTTDLDPALNPGVRYFVEGHYVHPDDCVVGTQDNNASYREVRVVPVTPGVFGLSIQSAWPTQRGQAAVRAWRDADPTVHESDIRVPGEGLFILAAKAIPRGDGYWRYSYALQNLNSDRSARSFSLLLPPGSIVENVQYHDAPYHSGEPYAHTAWAASIQSTQIRWFTEEYSANQQANALRYDTIANFLFDCNVEPDSAKVEIELFKPGLPTSVTGNTVGPRVLMVDCNENGITDLCDVDCAGLGCPPPCATSADCNGNSVPDECEPDCNANGVADECDIRDCPAGDLSCSDCNDNWAPDGCDPDCDGDAIPDDCEMVLDTDADGVEDCDDLCPLTTPQGGCLPPLDQLVVCCYPNGIYIEGVFTWRQCLETGGGPVCDDPPMCPGTPCRENACRAGCLIGDWDGDGDLDLQDFCGLQVCYSGSADTPGGQPPSGACLATFNYSEDGDLDGEDLERFIATCTGPE